MADRSLKLWSKNRPYAGTFDIPIKLSPVERGGRPRGLSPMAMFSIAVVDRGFKRLPLCSATILPFLDFLAQPLDFGRGHRA
jgi:hypothetical protein